MVIKIPFKFGSWQDKYLIKWNPVLLILHRMHFLCTGQEGIAYQEMEIAGTSSLARRWKRWTGLR